MVILFYYRRIGNYVDRATFSGIDYDRNVQRDYINAISSAYTFVADNVILYSEIMPNITYQEDFDMIIREEFPGDYSSENSRKNLILNAFLTGGVRAVEAYITERLNPITDEKDFTVEINREGDGVVIKRYNGNLHKVTIPSTIQGLPVKEIGSEAFTYFNGFTGSTPWREIIIPEGVKIISSYAFRYCDRLRKVELPSSIEIIGERAFEGCSNLIYLNIPNNIKEIADYAFDGCIKLDISIPEHIITQKTTLTNLFTGTGIKNFIIPEGITVIGHNAFRGCIELETITFPSTLLEIRSYAFENCRSLTTINIPESINTIRFHRSGASGDYFKGCQNLNLASQAALRRRGYEGNF